MNDKNLRQATFFGGAAIRRRQPSAAFGTVDEP